MNIVICPLSLLDEVIADHAPDRVVSLLSAELMIPAHKAFGTGRHLRLSMNDIDKPLDGHVPPGRLHVEKLIEFVDGWDRSKAMVVHCWAGISRSTAAAYTTLCHLNPDADEAEIARALRAASERATPNRLFVKLADDLLGREGRMVRAIEEIGRGADCWENKTFLMPSGFTVRRA